ncbi:MAG: hypothetical protein HKM89_04065 [Gemmatimonadales bacterium]|nr:hypothetical protein [Gemmatimonadales bacterium]
MADSLTYIAIWGQLLPIVALLFVRRPTPPALWLTGAALGLMFVQDTFMLIVAGTGINNLWLTHAALPLTTGLIVWSFSFWQVSKLARDAVRIAVAIYVVVWLVVSLAVEDFQQFSRFTAPLQALLVLSVAGYTLVTSFRGTDTPLRAPWFWVSLGWALYFGIVVVHDPISQLLLNAGQMEYLRTSYYVKAGFGVLSLLLLTGGVLCGRSRPTFGGSFSQPPAPSRFSSSPS